MVSAVYASLSETKRFHKEAFFFLQFAYGEQRAVEPAHRFRLPNFLGLPSTSLIVGIFDDLYRKARGMFEMHEELSEPFVNASMDNPIPVQMIDPEWQGPLRHRID